MTNLSLRKRAACAAIGLALCGCGAKSADESIAAGRAKLANHEPTYAIVELKNALQQSPESPEARFLLGRALLESGNPVAAVVEFRKAQALHHPDAEVVPALARALDAQGDYRKLIDELSNKTLPSRKATAELKTLLAEAYAASSETTKASAAADAALKAVPNHVPALLMRARLAATALRFDDAAAVIGQAMVVAPKDPDVWTYQGDALLIGRGDVKGAIEAYRKALDLDSKHAAARANLIALLIRTGDLKEAQTQLAELRKSRDIPVQIAFLDAQLAFANGDTKNAGEFIAQVLKVAPENVKALLVSGAISSATGALEAAERSLSKALSLSPASADARRQLARIHLRKGDADKALATVAPLIGSGTRDVQALVIAAEANMVSGRYADAKDRFAQVLEFNPKDLSSRTKMAVAELNLGSTDAATAELHSISAADPSTFADLALVNAAMSRKDFNGALVAVDAMDKKAPGKASTADLRGRILLLQNNEAAARKSFERAVSIDPAHLAAAVSLAQLDLKDGRPEAARRRFDEILAKDNKNLGAMVAVAALMARQGAAAADIIELLNKAVKLNPDEPSPRLLLINHYLAAKDFKNALSTARDAASAMPESTDVLDALGRVQAVSGDSLQAISTFQKLASMEPRANRAPLRIAAVHLAAKDYDAAAQSFRRALEITPDSLPTQQGLLETELAARHFAAALAFAKDVQKHNPQDVTGYTFEARVYVFQKAYGAAADTYRATLKRFPTADNASKLHATLLAAQQPAEAERFLTGWLEQHPKDLAFLAYAGDSATARKEFAIAEQRFKRFSELQPGNPRALANIALLLLQQNKPGAVAFAERADKLRPNSPELMDTLAKALAADRQFERALKVQNSALELEPANATMRLALAKLYVQAGMQAPARSQLETLSKLGAAFDKQAEVAQMLKAM